MPVCSSGSRVPVEAVVCRLPALPDTEVRIAIPRVARISPRRITSIVTCLECKSRRAYAAAFHRVCGADEKSANTTARGRRDRMLRDRNTGEQS